MPTVTEAIIVNGGSLFDRYRRESPVPIDSQAWSNIRLRVLNSLRLLDSGEVI